MSYELVYTSIHSSIILQYYANGAILLHNVDANTIIEYRRNVADEEGRDCRGPLR